MITLVTGGSGRGKSAYAEDILSSCEGTKYYIATMQIFDAEGEKKVKRHQRLRAGKGFITIESPVDAGKISFEEKEEGCGKKSALLECMSNLTANEMFSGNCRRTADEVAEKVITDLKQLCEKTDNLVIVTNNVFEDGILYDEGTMEYLKALGAINARLAAMADYVTEVVAGIPVAIKNPTKD